MLPASLTTQKKNSLRPIEAHAMRVLRMPSIVFTPIERTREILDFSLDLTVDGAIVRVFETDHENFTTLY
jgi:hypothetical protein